MKWHLMIEEKQTTFPLEVVKSIEDGSKNLCDLGDFESLGAFRFPKEIMKRQSA